MITCESVFEMDVMYLYIVIIDMLSKIEHYYYFNNKTCFIWWDYEAIKKHNYYGQLH